MNQSPGYLEIQTGGSQYTPLARVLCHEFSLFHNAGKSQKNKTQWSANCKC